MAAGVRVGKFERVNIAQRKPMDIWVFIFTMALVMVGLWMVYDTSYIKSFDEFHITSNSWKPIAKQASLGALGGMFALVFCWQFGYWRLRHLAIPLVIVGAILLVAVYLPVIGKSLNGAHRWIRPGIQPSEFAKFFLILYMARLFSRKDKDPRDFWEFVAPPIVAMIVYIVLIAKEPDLGTAFVMFLTGLTIFVVSPVKKRHLFTVITVLLVMAFLVIRFASHGQGRIEAFLHPSTGQNTYSYQVKHSRWAVGSGQIMGVGLGQGREKYYLPQQDSDFIFATVAEETGFAGCLVVISLILALGLRGLWIASQTQDPFGRLLAVGFSALILWQAFINMAVATIMIPATGVPLPFISNGASALVVMMASAGVLLSIAQHPLPPVKRRKEVVSNANRS